MSESKRQACFMSRFEKLDESGKRYVLAILQSLEFAQNELSKPEEKKTAPHNPRNTDFC